MKILKKASKEKPRDLWKHVDVDRYRVKTIHIIRQLLIFIILIIIIY
jgi:hypothetical protein